MRRTRGSAADDAARFGELPRNTGETQQFQQQVDQIWKAIEKSANGFIDASSSVTTKMYQYPSEEAALSALGMVIMDAGQLSSREKRLKKEKKEGKPSPVEPVCVGHILKDGSTYSLAMLHGVQMADISKLGSIRILTGKNDSSIVCNKKKCEVTIKFCVIPQSEESALVDGMEGPTDASGVDLSKCMSRSIREEEGLNYQLYMEQLALEAVKVDATPEAPAANNAAPAKEEMVVTAFEVSGDIDYTKLIEKFGSKPLTPYLLKRLERTSPSSAGDR
jgi:hypothetical protein